MTPGNIRVAGPQDAEAVERVLKDSYPKLMASAYEPGLLERALPLMTRAHPRLLGSGRYYLCEAEGEAVGCGGWSLERPGGDEIESGVAHIRHFAVRSDRTGRGVGRALYDRCEQDARLAGATEFECWSSLNGERFYAALGFTRIGAFDVAMGRDVMLPSIRMRRSL